MTHDDELHSLDAKVAAGQISIDEYLRQRAALIPSTSMTAAPEPLPAEPTPPPPVTAQAPASSPFTAAPPGAVRQSPTLGPDASGPFQRPAFLDNVPPGVTRAQPQRPGWTPPAPPAPSAGGPGTRKRSLVPWIAAGVLGALIIAGGGFLLVTRNSASPDPTPTGTVAIASSSPTTGTKSSTPAPPAVAPFGTIPGSTNNPATTGSKSLTQALDLKVLVTAERNALVGCNAANGLTQTITAPDWTARGWIFSCADVASGRQAVQNLAGYYHANGFIDTDLSTKGIYALTKPAANLSVVQAMYLSTSAIVFIETSSASPATAAAQAKALLKVAMAAYPSTFPT